MMPPHTVSTDSDGHDLFLVVGNHRIAKRVLAKWVPLDAEGPWRVSADLIRPVIWNNGVNIEG
jgi:hypothetical protein